MIDPYRARRVGLNISRAEILFAFCDDLAGLSGKNFTRPAIDPADALDQPTDDALFVKVMEDLIAQGILPPDPLIDELAEVFNIFESNTRALLTYIPSPVDVDIAAFYAETGSYEDSHYLKPWRPVNESIHEHSYAADHFAIMREPIASVIAAALKQTIETRR
jgi:thioesterase domain-containing protein